MWCLILVPPPYPESYDSYQLHDATKKIANLIIYERVPIIPITTVELSKIYSYNTNNNGQFFPNILEMMKRKPAHSQVYCIHTNVMTCILIFKFCWQEMLFQTDNFIYLTSQKEKITKVKVEKVLQELTNSRPSSV